MAEDRFRGQIDYLTQKIEKYVFLKNLVRKHAVDVKFLISGGIEFH